MDTYNLINSKAIREYCRKIKHQFNAEELAVLVYRNKSMSVDEKISAYKELINDYPDMEVIERINCKHYDSVKVMIKQEIDRLKTMIELLYREEQEVIYTYNEFNKYVGEYLESREFDVARGTFNEIEKDIYDYIEQYDEECEITSFRIKKVSLKDKKYKIFAIYKVENKKLVLTDVYDVEEQDYLDINNIFLNIPNPFKKGDLLTNGSKIFVLEWLCTEQKNLKEILAKGNKDSSDMEGTCYFINEYREIYWDNIFNYDNWEYFEGKLEGFERILKAISSLLKNEIGPDLFLTACEVIKLDNNKENLNWFTNEGLELAGFSKDDIENIKK